MPAFKKFGPDDQVDNVLILEPQYNLASGSGGWRGSPEGSASLSLYGGARRSPAHVVNDISYQSLFPGLSQTPRPRLGLPTTASVNFVWMTDESLSVTQRSSTRWGEEHWDTIQRLYQDYYGRDPDYVTGSYDHYCLYFQRDSRNTVNFGPPTTGNRFKLTASFTVESWIKPFQTASVNQDFTIASMNRVFWFGITGSTGQLKISSSFGFLTSTVGPSVNRWSHVSFAYDASSLTGAFTINMADVGGGTQATFSATLGGFTPIFSVGNQVSGNLTAGVQEEQTFAGQVNRSFFGFIGETRLWYLRRTVAQISASMNVALTASVPAFTGSVIRSRLNTGPLATFPSDANYRSPSAGSGVLDLAALEQIISNKNQSRYSVWGKLVSFDDRAGPVWHPVDNINYIAPKSLAAAPQTHPNEIVAFGSTTGLTGSGVSNVRRMLVIDIPQAFYGRQIVPNSVVLVDRSWSSGSYGLVRTLVDDGRGGLYLSGSACSSSLAGREDYAGVGWNKVGNVFYGEGLIVIKDPALLDFGAIHNDFSTANPPDLLQISFRGQSRIPVKTLMCRVDRGDFNASSNQTFWTTDTDGNRVRRHVSGNLYTTTVGVYNSELELVGVARLADPVRIRDRDRINIKLRMDF